MITAELDTSTIEITNSTDNVVIDNTNIIAGYDNSYNVDIEDLSDLDITVAKKEYTIVGDDIYIPQLYDDAPQWMKDLVGLVVDVSMTTNSTKLINDMNAMLQEFAVSYVPLNQYTQSILDLGNEDMRLNAIIETLNSNFNNGLSEANAQIIDLKLTKASKEEVVAQVIQTISAQLADPDSNIGATIGRLDRAIATEQQARALSMSVLTASIESVDADVIANAEVVQSALAYVGIDEAGASTGTGLSAYLEASDGTIGGADSQLANTIRVTAEGVESKWAYNSIVNINGVYKKSGFGLTTNYTSGAGTQANPYTSEFWIDATKLRFTNSDMTGRNTPFTIDASGTTPQIKFNGVVEFSNVLNASKVYTQDTLPGGTRQLGDLWIKPSVNGAQWYWNGSSWVYQDLASIINSNTTTINGGRITTGSITAGQISAFAITADKINTNGLIAEDIRANVLTGKTLNGVSINGSTITGSIIKASYLDLRDDLTPVTDYVITPAVYASDPNRYHDSVYISGTNTYRIPSVIPLYSLATERSLGDYPNVLQNSIWSYQAANKGNTNKCVKRVPVLKIKEEISMRLSANEMGGSGAIFDSPTIEIKVGGVSSGHFKVNAIYVLESGDRFSFRYATLYRNGSVVSQYVDTAQTYTINGVPVVVSVSSGQGGYPMIPGSFTLSIPPGTYTLSSGFEGDTNSIIECAITVQGSRNPFFGWAFQNIHAVIGQMEITNNIFQGWDI